MTESYFDKIVEARLEKIKSSLVIKGKEYRRDNNPMHNFEVAARVSDTTREKALWAFATKHYVSFLDMLNNMEKGIMPLESTVDEKIGDLINYLILAEASIKDKIAYNKLPDFSDEH